MRPSRWSVLEERLSPYILLAPFLFFILVFFGYAFARALYFSFTDYNLFTKPTWIWFRNYANLFRDYQFGRAFKNSVTFAVLVTFTQTALGLALAVFMNQRIRGIHFFRAAYYMPSVTSSVVITLIFMWLYQRMGLINFLATKVMEHRVGIGLFFAVFAAAQTGLVRWERAHKRPAGALEPSLLLVSACAAAVVVWVLAFAGVVRPDSAVQPIRTIWLNTRQTFPQWAGALGFPVPLGAIMILNIWTTAPTMMLLFLAGLQDIPRELYEAAAVDGATGLASFRHITLPCLRHVTFLVLTMGLISTLQMFDQVAIVGDQAPLESIITLAYYVYHNAFPGSAVPRIGMASAAAMILAVFTLVLVLVQKRITRA
ncbi:MAG: sugar ABC transporter permease [Firmicutes bacterium]|nr:sugar ABC transporter permease [Bacillota bacterium]